MEIQRIATVRSCFGDKFAVPRQPGLSPSAFGTLIFEEPFRSVECLRGIDGFSHLWLIFGFHKTLAEGWHPTVRPPRLGGNHRVGVFASRSTFRPNALGLSVVKLEGVDLTDPLMPVLRLGGLDLVDGTPIYDVKPYLNYADVIEGSKSGYASEPLSKLQVEIGPKASAGFSSLGERSQRVIREVLACDPRPAVRTDDSARVFGAAICGMEVKFTIHETTCVLRSVTPSAGSGLND